jgi:hypothetical protein
MLRTEALSVVLLATALGSGIALAVLAAFSVGMTGSALWRSHPWCTSLSPDCSPSSPRRCRAAWR